jgi:acylphosphatase
VAEGTPESLQELVQWCHHGPPLARVEKVEVKSGELKGFNDFVQIL